MFYPPRAASALAAAVLVVFGLMAGPQNTPAYGAPMALQSVSAVATPASATASPAASPSVIGAAPVLAPGKAASQVRISGCTKSQKKSLVSYIKKWGKYSNINSITCKSRTSHLGVTTMYFYPNGSATIILRKSMSGTKFRQVAVHEIMHAVESYDYGQRGALEWPQVRSELGHVFGYGSGKWGVLEVTADCMTQRATGSKAYLHYKPHGCSASQRSAAGRLIAGHQV